MPVHDGIQAIIRHVGHIRLNKQYAHLFNIVSSFFIHIM